MKKEIIKILLLSFILITISLLLVFITGNTTTITFRKPNNQNYNIEIENDTGEITILDEKQTDNEYIIKIKGIKPGKSYIGLKVGELADRRIVYIHKNMVTTTNSYFGKTTCSEAFPISIAIILIYTLYILIKRYKKNTKENLYQYKNVTYLGTIIFLTFFTIDDILTIFNYHGIEETISKTINSMSTLSIVLFPIAMITFILVTISNIKLIIKEGKSLRNLLGLFLGIFICLSTLLPDFIYEILLKSQTINIFNLNSIGPYLYNFIESLVYLSISYLECILIGTIIVAIKSVNKKIKYDKDYIIILGCQIRKDGTLTPLLKGRVDKALEFRQKQLLETSKDVKFIPSGGKGNDEVISESEAIKNYLVEKGIKESNIIIENKSMNTYENFKYSKKLIKKKNANLLFSTTNYHVFRAGLLATEQEIKIEGIGSKTKIYFWINAFIREFIGTLYSEKKKHIFIIIIIAIILVLMISMTYLSNNI